jgi:hypothetical protein
MAIDGVTFQSAAERLQDVASAAPQAPEPSPQNTSSSFVSTSATSENPPFKGTYEKIFKPHAG